MRGCRAPRGGFVEEGRVEILVRFKQFGRLFLLDDVREDIRTLEGQRSQLESGQLRQPGHRRDHEDGGEKRI